MDKSIERYRQLRYHADRMAENLETLHCGRITCRRGCCQCCTNLTVLPVEFFSIVEEMKKAGWTRLSFDAAAICGYLNEQGECEIYAFRPMICRTQGLPLAFYDDDAQGYSVTFCPKNFIDADKQGLDFGPDNTLNLDDLNDALFDIHLQFIADHPEMGFKENTRIELSRLGEWFGSDK